MLRLKAAAAMIVVVAACGRTTPPTELHTAAEPQAVVPEALPRITAASTSEPHMMLAAPPVPVTTTTMAPAPAPPPPPPVVSEPAPPPPQVSAASSPATGGCGGWGETIAAHFPPEQVAKACSVMACETGGTYDPTIHNPSSSASGLFQFLDSTWRSTTGLAPPAAAYPGEQQVAAAAALWRSSGWSPWACA